MENDRTYDYVTPSFSIPEDLLDKIERRARKEDRSKSSVVRRALRQYLDEQPSGTS